MHPWSIFLVTGMIWRTSLVASKVLHRPCHLPNACIHRCIFCYAHLGAYVVLPRPNGLGRGREGEISCACSCYEGTCSGLSPSGRSELLSGAAPPCISLFDLFPMASIAFHFGLHGFDASAFTSLRTSYRLLGWVTFVHHSVKVHVRRLLALGYDSLEYFIFYIPLNTFGFGHITWPILHLFTFEFNGSSRAPAHGPGPNGICKPTLVFGRSPAGVLKLGTCISFHVRCMFSTACILHDFPVHVFLHGGLSACMNLSCAVLQCISFHLQPFALGFVFFHFLHRHLPTLPPVHVGSWCCPSMHFVVRSVSDGIDCIPFRFARFRCLGVYIASNFVSFAGVGHVCAPFGKSTCPSAACIRI